MTSEQLQIHNKIEFKSEIINQNNNLKIVYSVTNNSSDVVFLFNKLYVRLNEAKQYECDKNLVYAYLEGNSLTIKKSIPAKPDSIDVEKLIIPCVTKIESHDSYSEEFLIPKPVTLFDPYLPSTNQIATSENSTFKSVTFELGYFSTNLEGSKLAKTINTIAGKALLFDPFPIQRMKTFRSIFFLKGNVQ